MIAKPFSTFAALAFSWFGFFEIERACSFKVFHNSLFSSARHTFSSSIVLVEVNIFLQDIQMFS